MSGLEAIGIAANIIQVVDFGVTVLGRLKEYHSAIGEVPKSFRHTKLQLPALLDALGLMKDAIDRESLSERSKDALLPIIQGCKAAIEALDDVMILVLPSSGDSRMRKNTKALKSLRYQGKIDKIMSVVTGYVQTLNYYVSTLSALRDQISIRPVATSTVPFGRDADFVDRKILTVMDQQLQVPAARMALVGLGGIGKSQIAIEYSYRVRDKSPQTWVFWVHAGSTTRFENDYRRIAEAVKVRGYKDPKADIFQLVHAWLSDESNGQWLMIVDNADDENVFYPATSAAQTQTRLLSDYIPQSRNGSVLLTSRNKDLARKLAGAKAHVVEIHPMDTSDGLSLLQNRLGSSVDEQSAAELLGLLDNMPLAITQAAAYIERHAPRMTIPKYIDELRRGDQSQAKLLGKDVGDIRRDGRASNSIMQTWNITFELLRQDKPSAARLLSLMSLFDRQGIPEFLLHGQYRSTQSLTNEKHEYLGLDKEATPSLSGLTLNETGSTTQKSTIQTADHDEEDDFEEDIHTLISYSLVKVSDTGDSFEMHRLVQFATKQWLELYEALEEWKVAYVNLLHAAFPLHPKPEAWPLCQVLFPHIQASIASRPADSDPLEKWAFVLYKAGWYSVEMGNFEIAEEVLRHSLKATEDVLGFEHPKTLDIISELGAAVEELNKLDEAESLHRRALEARMKTLGSEHRDTLLSMSNIAQVLRRQKRSNEAEELQSQIVTVNTRVFGPEAPETLDSMASLALTYGALGRFSDEEELERNVLELTRKTMGDEHRDTLTSMHHLAITFKRLNRPDEAIATMRTCFELRQKVLGAKHPHTMSSQEFLQVWQDEALLRKKEMDS